MRAAGGDIPNVSSLVLLTIPLSWLLLAALLAMSVETERRMLSPRALIVRTARTRTSPEHAEKLVAAEVERLLRDTQRR